jgi:hypothetical protein
MARKMRRSYSRQETFCIFVFSSSIAAEFGFSWYPIVDLFF